MLQGFLNTLSYLGRDKNQLLIDGDVGTNTVYAIRQFQISNGLRVDGIPSFYTWSALRKAIEVKSNPIPILGTVTTESINVIETLCNDSRISVPIIGMLKIGDKVELQTVSIFKSLNENWYFIKYCELGGYVPTKYIML